VIWTGNASIQALTSDWLQEPHHRRLAFDLGDVGIGQLTNSLELGCDCLGHIHYFDAVLNNSKGGTTLCCALDLSVI